MRQRILFIGGTQDGQYNNVTEKVKEMKLDVFSPFELRALRGIVPHPKPLYTEIYRRQSVDGGADCFVLVGTSEPDLSKYKNRIGLGGLN